MNRTVFLTLAGSGTVSSNVLPRFAQGEREAEPVSLRGSSAPR